MTAQVADVGGTRAPALSDPAAPVRWRPVLAIAIGTAVGLMAFANRYGYNDDELYYRMLGQHGFAWGYTDQPLAIPQIMHLTTILLGDSLWAIRVPAALCAAVIVTLGAIIAADLGGRRAQIWTAAGLATSTLVLSVGHVMITSTGDLVAWSAFSVCTVRALVRRDRRWCYAAAVVCGLALYTKYLFLILPVSLLVALIITGSWRLLTRRVLWAALLIALLVASPNIIYQVTHGLPQWQMIRALSGSDGPVNRVILLPGQLLILGLAPAAVCLVGLIGLFRNPDWRPIRPLGVAYCVALGAVLIGGGRADYVGGFLIPLFAVGCVRVEHWAPRGRRLLAAAMAVSIPLQLLVALPILPPQSLSVGALNDISLESIGWPQFAHQVESAYSGMPAASRGHIVILANTIGEAGALDRYGTGLPVIFSGQNELYLWGPPPETDRAAVAIGVARSLLNKTFAKCSLFGHVSNGFGVQNTTQGAPIYQCVGRKTSWAKLWPLYHYLSG